MTFDEFAEKVRGWAMARDIYQNSTARAQLLKAFSEMGELADAEIKGERAAQIDGVGDVLTCLVNYCHMTGIDIHESMQDAWNEIKDRKGRMVAGGAFVKE